jgi:hypothetical protein
MENGGRARGADPSLSTLPSGGQPVHQPVAHVVEDFRRSASVLIAKFAYICGKLGTNFTICAMMRTSRSSHARAISLLVYQIGARFLGHRRLGRSVAMRREQLGFISTWASTPT